jgi:hypothetical protein
MGCSLAAAGPASAQSAAITVSARRIGTSGFCGLTWGWLFNALLLVFQ